MSQRVYTLIQKSVEAIMNVGEVIAPHIDAASDIMVEALLAEKKIIVCGSGRSEALANIFTASLLDKYEKDRPGLPAIMLNKGITDLNMGTQQSEVYAKPLRALGEHGDIFLIIYTSDTDHNLEVCIDIAHDKGMRVIALCAYADGDCPNKLNHNDVAIKTAANSPAHLHQLHLLCLFSLCDLIDHKLFGME